MEQTGALPEEIAAIHRSVDWPTRPAARGSGWFQIMWGTIWLLGLLGLQFLPTEMSGRLLLVLIVCGGMASGGFMLRARRRSKEQSPYTRALVLGWLALAVFDDALCRAFALTGLREQVLLIALTTTLGLFIFGLFTSRKTSVVAACAALFTITTARWLPNYFFLSMALMSGGLLIGHGYPIVRRGATSG